MPHKRTERKLEAYGIGGKVLNWVCDFLQDGCQHVGIASSLSSMEHVTSGVPQGSVLGPMLFAMHVSELSSIVRSNMVMFADNAKLY